MRQHYTPYTIQDFSDYRALKRLMDSGCDRNEAASRLHISYQRARRLLSRSYPTPEEMRARRKDFIVKKLTEKGASKIRITPYRLANFFMIDETFVLQMMKELRSEGRLPKATTADEDHRQRVQRVLQRHFPNVYPAWVVEKKEDVLMVHPKGWMSWDAATELARELEPEQFS